jgi:hypothetical protein
MRAGGLKQKGVALRAERSLCRYHEMRMGWDCDGLGLDTCALCVRPLMFWRYKLIAVGFFEVYSQVSEKKKVMPGIDDWDKV